MDLIKNYLPDFSKNKSSEEIVQDTQAQEISMSDYDYMIQEQIKPQVYLQRIPRCAPWTMWEDHPAVYYKKQKVRFNQQLQIFQSADAPNTGEPMQAFFMTVYAVAQHKQNQHPNAPYLNIKTGLLTLKPFNKKSQKYYSYGFNKNLVEGCLEIFFPLLNQQDDYIWDTQSEIKCVGRDILNLYLDLVGSPQLVVSEEGGIRTPILRRLYVVTIQNYFSLLLSYYDFLFTAQGMSEPKNRQNKIFGDRTFQWFYDYSFFDALTGLMSAKIEIRYYDINYIYKISVNGKYLQIPLRRGYQEVEDNVGDKVVVAVFPFIEFSKNPMIDAQQRAYEQLRKKSVEQLKNQGAMLCLINENTDTEDRNISELLHFMRIVDCRGGKHTLTECGIPRIRENKISVIYYWMIMYYYVCHYNHWMACYDLKAERNYNETILDEGIHLWAKYSDKDSVLKEDTDVSFINIYKKHVLELLSRFAGSDFEISFTTEIVNSINMI